MGTKKVFWYILPLVILILVQMACSAPAGTPAAQPAQEQPAKSSADSMLEKTCHDAAGYADEKYQIAIDAHQQLEKAYDERLLAEEKIAEKFSFHILQQDSKMPARGVYIPLQPRKRGACSEERTANDYEWGQQYELYAVETAKMSSREIRLTDELLAMSEQDTLTFDEFQNRVAAVIANQ